MKLKICGLSKAIEVETCVNYEVDYCGFILNYPKSHRFISLDVAKNLTSIKKDKTQYVGVLVKPSQAELEIFSKLSIDYFQLYGNYSAKDILDIKTKFQKKIIYSIQVKNREDVEIYKKIEKVVDIILWDSSGYEESLSWDYNWLRSVSTKAERMLAGNITEEKLRDLVSLAEIVDVSGALETNKVKDIYKIKKFIMEIKKINAKN